MFFFFFFFFKYKLYSQASQQTLITTRETTVDGVDDVGWNKLVGVVTSVGQLGYPSVAAKGAAPSIIPHATPESDRRHWYKPEQGKCIRNSNHVSLLAHVCVLMKQTEYDQ